MHCPASSSSSLNVIKVHLVSSLGCKCNRYFCWKLQLYLKIKPQKKPKTAVVQQNYKKPQHTLKYKKNKFLEETYRNVVLLWPVKLTNYLLWTDIFIKSCSCKGSYWFLESALFVKPYKKAQRSPLWGKHQLQCARSSLLPIHTVQCFNQCNSKIQRPINIHAPTM